MNTILEKTGKRLLARQLEQYAPADPLYEYYTTNQGKTKRRKRALPPGLSKREAKVLESIQKRAHYLDKGFCCCGFRFGWAFVIGIIPVVGDVTNMTVNHYFIIRKAQQAEIPTWLTRKMMMNNVVSTIMGSVPLVGDVGVAAFKTNSRNAALLEAYLKIRGEATLARNPDVNAESSSRGDSPKRRWLWFTKKNGGGGTGAQSTASRAADGAEGELNLATSTPPIPGAFSESVVTSRPGTTSSPTTTGIATSTPAEKRKSLTCPFRRKGMKQSTKPQ